MSEKQKKRSKFNWKTNRKLRLGTSATVFTVFVVAAVLVLNLIVGIIYDRFPLTLDLTTDKTFTMSDESREVAQNVTQDLEILVFLEENTFAAPSTGNDVFDTILRQFYLFTKDYNTLSGGHVTTKYLDAEADPTLVNTYKQYEVTTGSILFRTKEHFRVISVDDLYTEELDSSYQTVYSSVVEQKLASTINTVCVGKEVTLTFLTGHGEDQTAISTIQKLYSLNGYNVDTLDLSTATEVNETTEAMIIVGPTKDFTLDEISRLRAWLSNDGKLNRDLYVMCNYSGDCPNLYTFLKDDYGITVTDRLIVETDTNNYLQLMGDMMPLTTVEDSDLTAEIAGQTVLMPFTLQLETSFGTATDEEPVTNYPLITFPESAKLLPQSALNEETETEAESAKEYPVIGMAYAKELRQTSDHAGETNVIVSGSYLFPSMTTLSQYKNEALTLEPIRSVCSLGESVYISSTDLNEIVIDFSAAEAQSIRIFMTAIPVLLVAASLVVFLKRRHL